MKPAVLVIANLDASFVLDDLRYLEQAAEVRFHNTKKQGLLNASLTEAIARADVVVCWFASAHAVAPALLCRAAGIPFVLISGGYDTASVPAIGYGNAGHRLKKKLTGLVLSLSDAVVVNSKFSAGDVLRFRPDVKPRLRIIPHDITPVDPDQIPQRDPRLLLTVTRLVPLNYRRKKMELIKQTARALPDYKVVHIGVTDDRVRPVFFEGMPENMMSLGHVSAEELWRWYYKASGLLIPSWHEGFGLTAVEAPAAGCVPFISGAGAQPEVTLGHAVTVSSDDPEVWGEAVRSNLPVSGEKQQTMMKEIRQNYTGGKRADALAKLIMELTQA